MRTAIHRTTCFETVTDDLAATTGTRRCHRVNCTLEAVKGHGPSSLYDLEGLVIVIATDIAFWHWILRDATDCRDNNVGRQRFPNHAGRPEGDGQQSDENLKTIELVARCPTRFR
jgi:hypothetical protein